MKNFHHTLGMDTGDYEWLSEACDQLCWICGKKERTPNRRLAVDHDHSTGSVRGLLCTSCNRRLGKGEENWHMRAWRYLVIANNFMNDECVRCGRLNRPIGILPNGKSGVHCKYACIRCKRQWGCYHRTKGVPYPWKMLGGGAPVMSGHVPCLWTEIHAIEHVHGMELSIKRPAYSKIDAQDDIEDGDACE